MTNFTLYRKEIEMLEITKQLLSKGQYHGGYRESIDELFYEKDHHFRQDFLELIPVEKLESIKELLFFLKNVNSSSRWNGHTTLGAYARGNREIKDILNLVPCYVN